MNNDKGADFEFSDELTVTVESREPIVVGITHGDMNGIGYEVIMKALYNKEMLSMIIPVLYGNPKALNHFRKLLGMEDLQYNQIPHAGQLHRKRINLVNVSEQEVNIETGTSSSLAGELAVKALEQSVADLKKGTIGAVVTAPINKENIQGPNFNFSGHTEYFANRFNVKEADTLMFMIHDNLRIGLVTNHLPLSQVPTAIDKGLIVHKIRIMNKSLERDFGVRKPRIAVLSLNPHAGDNGFLGSEEKKIIEPAISECFNKGILVYGPYAADGFFGSGKAALFDGILAMYHDQGLVAFKSIAEGEGVNYTAGLPVVRTSPAHGTAYDIAGKNAASADSMTEAIFLAIDIFHNRKAYDEIYSNPLKIGLAQEMIGAPKTDESIDPFAETED